MMRYICVNLLSQIVQKDGTFYPCTICCTAIGKSYVRDLATRLVYHNAWCMSLHIAETEKCIEHVKEA